MIFEFTGEVWFWKGPAPFYFVTVPEKESRELKEILTAVTYGWGMIPVNAQVGKTEWYTALWPKDGRWILPLKDLVRKAESIAEGDMLTARLEVVKSR
ncbi:MAG TPA: DUF1905 domain-containing protein [Fimbriimonadaceae bacterium]|nr:DUF1905 domain-containing protein [Fimbriimonadaceae bacterium]